MFSWAISDFFVIFVYLLLLLHSRNSLPVIRSGLRDGVIRTYDLFTAYSPGYFQLEILACDFAGHSATTNVNIYILRDDQRVKIVFNEIPDLVRQSQEEFVGLLSHITGAVVNMDDIQVRSCPGPFIYFFPFYFTASSICEWSLFRCSSTWIKRAG